MQIYAERHIVKLWKKLSGNARRNCRKTDIPQPASMKFWQGKYKALNRTTSKPRLVHEIEKTHTHIHSVEDKLTAQIHAVENRLDARIDLVQEQIKSTNTRIDSLEASTNMRMDDMKTIIDKMDKRISVMFAISGIVFTGIFTILGVILSKLG